MRCHNCNEYIPENLGIKKCIKCGTELNEKTDIKDEALPMLQTEQPVEIKYQELTKDQTTLLEERFDKGLKSLLYASVLWIIILVSIIVPIRFIPTRKAHAIQGLEANQTFSEFFGIVPTIIFLLIIGIFIYGLALRHSKFLSIRKDLKERKTITIISKITDIRELKGDREKEYDVFLEKNTEGLKKLNYLQSEFPDIRKGDTIKVTLTKNAHCAVSTEIVSRSL